MNKEITHAQGSVIGSMLFPQLTGVHIPNHWNLWLPHMVSWIL